MPNKRFLLNPTRTAKQRVGINLGKFTEDYERIVSVMTMHPEDMASIGASDGDTCRVSTEEGETTFMHTRQCPRRPHFRTIRAGDLLAD